jgi:outer membrane receptor protein involved in Fe transport
MRRGFVLLICLMSTGAWSLDLDFTDHRLQIHGFLTQAYVKTTENQFFGDSENGSFEFRELGINASYRFNPNLMISAQLLSRVAGEMYDGSLAVDYAQLDYHYSLSEEKRLGLILGRYKNPLGLYNDTRDVAATRPGIFMPQAIYWDRVRNMVLSNDGLQLRWEHDSEMHRIKLQLVAGKTPIDKNVEETYRPPTLSASMDQDGLTYGGRLLYEWDGGRFRLALSSAMLELDTKISMLPEGNMDLDYWVLSAQYNDGPWRLTLEYMQEPLDFRGFGDFLDAADTTVDGYYLQGDYRLHEDWEVMLRYEESHYNKDDPDGVETSLKIGGVPHNHYSKLWTLGLLWEPSEQLMLRAEFSRVDGTIFLSNLDNPLPNEMVKDWNLFSLLFSHSF